MMYCTFPLNQQDKTMNFKVDFAFVTCALEIVWCLGGGGGGGFGARGGGGACVCVGGGGGWWPHGRGNNLVEGKYALSTGNNVT